MTSVSPSVASCLTTSCAPGHNFSHSAGSATCSARNPTTQDG
eukprot:CAMPEP_0204500520 /NCGR_PEP_ID=MMETSP0471-20130131/97361_1 /ASSEMBLY_ACC=CAM_ASM_000602 /TAXON_ID=2969 /ORGANISM="Oxyrrhis marina" /LENGTH=41 /DNA_ID= /DNA_START= /DNA_END= /DNA_ORIENTATION=